MRAAVLLGILFAVVAVAAPAAQTGELELERLLERRSAACPRPLPDGAPPPRTSGPQSPLPPGFGLDSVIRSDFICNDDTAGGCTQSSPSLEIHPDGSFVLSWYEFRDGDADVWFQRFNADGTPVGSNERINTDVTMGWNAGPSTGVGPGGRFLFTWEDRRRFGDSDIYCQLFDINGLRVGDNFRASDSGARSDQSANDVHVAPDGRFFAAWDDRRYGITGDIFARFFDSSGSALDSGFRVNDDPIGLANQYRPAAGGDDSGRYVVTWMDGRGHNASDWNIFAQRFGPDGARLGSNIQVTVDDSIQWSPGIGVGPSGRFVVCWEDRRKGGEIDVYAQRYDADGDSLGGNFKVNADPGGSDQYVGRVAMNSQDEFLVVWTDRRDGNEDVYGQRFDASGQPLGANFRVNDVATGDQTSAVVDAHPDDGYWVAWADSRFGSLDIFVQRFDRDGQRVGANILVNDDRGSSLQRVSSIGMDGRGVSCVAWEDERNGRTDIYRVLFDSTGQPLGANRRVNDDGPGGNPQYYVSVAGGASRYLLAWTDARSGYNIYGQFLDGLGEPLGGNRRVNSAGVDDTQWYPTCAMDSSNRAVVAWMDTREQDFYRIFVRFYGPDLNPLAPEFPVSDSFVQQLYAGAAMNDAGLALIVWMDYRDSESNVYGRLFHADGTPVGPDFRISTDTDSAYQGYPVCGVAEDNSFAVAWEDTRNGSYEIYMQWFDSIGAPIGDNIRVVDGPGEVDYYSPTCSYDRTGRLAVMFNDERENDFNPQVYCQRFRSDRSRLSGNRKVNEPNLFANDHHWTVGQSVAADEGRLAFAWTGNRRHLGWDIVAKLTDWDLVGVADYTRRPLEPGRWLAPTVSAARSVRLTPGCVGRFGIDVFDRAGRCVASGDGLRNGDEFSMSALAAGVYFVVLETEEASRRAKIVLE